MMTMMSMFKIGITAVLLATAAAVGCSQSGSEVGDRNAVDKDDAENQQTSEEKSKYKRKLKEQMDELDATLEDLEQKGENLSGDAKQQWEQTRADLEKKRERLAEEYEDLSAASDDAWQDVKKGVEAAWTDLKQATKDAAEYFDEQPDDSAVDVKVGDGVDVKVGDGVKIDIDRNDKNRRDTDANSNDTGTDGAADPDAK